jgi:hypothetical protein
VRRRHEHFMAGLAQSLPQLAPGLAAAPGALEELRGAAARVLEALPAPEYEEVDFERLQLRLRFKHDCE